MSFNQDIIALHPNVDRLLPAFLFWTLKSKEKAILADGIKPGVTVQSFHNGYFSTFKIPLPPLDVQKEIVVEIEAYQKVIDGARAVLDHYRPHIPINPEWPTVELGDIAEIQFGKMLDRNKHTTGHLLPYLRNISVRWGDIETHDLPQMYFEDDELDRYGLLAGDVVVCEGGSYPGRAAVWDGRIPNMKFQKALHRVRFKIPFEPQLLVEYLRMIDGTPALESHFSGSTIKHLTGEAFSQMRFPLPPVAEQEKIVAEIEAEQRLVEGNRQLIERMEQKITAVLARIWGEPEAATAGPTNEEG